MEWGHSVQKEGDRIMKVRTDFVTNSSSSSFILARKGELTEKQKDIIVQLVVDRMLGERILIPENSEEEIQKVFEEYYIDEDDQKQIRTALKEGKSIYSGWISFEESDYNLANMFTRLWEKLEEADSDHFETIDGSLDY